MGVVEVLDKGQPVRTGGYKVDVSRGERNGRVSSEWFNRPDDERYLSLDDLWASVKGRSERSRSRVVQTADIRVEATRDSAERLNLMLPKAQEPVAPTHWAFGQLAGIVGAPAAYLRSGFPDDASPAHQADVLVALLDHLRIERLPVIGGSAGALCAAEVALRHPDRCSHLVLLVPAANLTGRDPVEFTALQRSAVDLVLGSDFAFWALCRLAPGQMIRTLLATDPALLARVAPEERRRALLILDGLLPISRKADGLRTDGFWASAPSPTAYEDIAVPTLILSCEDDLFGTADTARRLAERIPDARLTIWPEGGHIWLGHDTDVAREITTFVARG